MRFESLRRNIHIHNLTVTINLTAEVVQQLNMNPGEVINQLTEQIQQTSRTVLACQERGKSEGEASVS